MNLVTEYELQKKQHPYNPEQCKLFLRQALEKPRLAYFEKLLSEGQLEKAQTLLHTELVGNESRYFAEVIKRMKSGQFLSAAQLFGESPKTLLLKSVRSLSRRNDWVKLMPKGLGIGLLATGLAYIIMAVGKNNQFVDDLGDTRVA